MFPCNDVSALGGAVDSNVINTDNSKGTESNSTDEKEEISSSKYGIHFERPALEEERQATLDFLIHAIRKTSKRRGASNYNPNSQTLNQALQSDDAKQWIKAIDDELKNMEVDDVYTRLC